MKIGDSFYKLSYQIVGELLYIDYACTFTLKDLKSIDGYGWGSVEVKI